MVPSINVVHAAEASSQAHRRPCRSVQVAGTDILPQPACDTCSVRLTHVSGQSVQTAIKAAMCRRSPGLDDAEVRRRAWYAFSSGIIRPVRDVQGTCIAPIHSASSTLSLGRNAGSRGLHETPRLISMLPTSGRGRSSRSANDAISRNPTERSRRRQCNVIGLHGLPLRKQIKCRNNNIARDHNDLPFFLSD